MSGGNISSTYQKLNEDGTVNPSSSQLQVEDYELIPAFLKATFSDTPRVQKEIDQTLKRTFVLKMSDKKAANVRREKSLAKRKKNQQSRFPEGVTIINNWSKGKLRRHGVVINELQKIPKKIQYNSLIELNTLWKKYVSVVLSHAIQQTEIQTRLCRIDLHGAHITLVSKPNRPSGIVIKETKNTFIVVTEENRPKMFPKIESLFEIQLDEPSGVLQIAGNSFLTRPAERASKKIKSFMSVVGQKKYESTLKYSTYPPDSDPEEISEN